MGGRWWRVEGLPLRARRRADAPIYNAGAVASGASSALGPVAEVQFSLKATARTSPTFQISRWRANCVTSSTKSAMPVVSLA